MKEKIITFIIGILVGAIITTGCYYLYSKANNNHRGGMKEGNRPSMMQQDEKFENENNTDMTMPPENPVNNDNEINKRNSQKKSNTNNENTNDTENTNDKI